MLILWPQAASWGVGSDAHLWGSCLFVHAAWEDILPDTTIFRLHFCTTLLGGWLEMCDCLEEERKVKRASGLKYSQLELSIAQEQRSKAGAQERGKLG